MLHVRVVSPASLTEQLAPGRDHLQRVMPQPARCFHDGMVSEDYDVIIVGSGAGGGTLAHTLAPSGQAHELDNLYIVDTSFFPSIGAVNPALTVMASAIRVGEHFLGRMS